MKNLDLDMFTDIARQVLNLQEIGYIPGLRTYGHSGFIFHCKAISSHLFSFFLITGA